MTKKDFPPSPWHGTNFVGGVGPKGARILILGEAPGAKENYEGKPFVGGAGKVLNLLLRRAELAREECYITNVIKYQPPGNDISSSEAQDYVKRSLPHLLREIREVGPTVIVPLGNTALQALGFNYRIGRARGAIIPSDFGKIIPTYHPAYFMRQWHEIDTGHRDWAKIAKHSKHYSYPRYTENFNLFPTVEDVEMLARSITLQTRSGQPVNLGIDLETFYIPESVLDIPIKTVSIAISDSTATVIPFINQDGSRYWKSPEEETRAIMALGQILEDPAAVKIFHNGLFDVQVLMNHGFTVASPIFDTMIAHYLIYHPTPHTLEYLVSIYSEYEPWKLQAGRNDKEFREYNARDTVVLHMILKPVIEDLRDNAVMPVFENLMRNLVPTCQMMLNGIAISQKQYTEVRANLEADLEVLTKELQDLAEEPGLNPDSPDQLRDVLFKKMRLKSQVKTKGGKLSTSEDVLNRLALRNPNNTFVQKLLKHRELSQRYKTFVKNLRVGEDGRVHSEFKMTGTVTGRFSSKNPNLQNLPKRKDTDGYIRRMYAPPSGRVIVAADWSQLELMIFATMAEDQIWQEAFAKGEDVHVINGKMLIGDVYDNSSPMRTFIKNFIYGLIYGSEGSEVERLIPRALIGKISVTGVMETLRETHPWLFMYRQQIEASINSKHYVRNAYGRKRWFPGTPSKADYRAGINFPIQSTAADIVHEKMYAIHEALQFPEDLLILQLHDEFFIETSERRANIVAGHLKRIMEETVFTPLGYRFDLKADVRIGTSLSEKGSHPWMETQQTGTAKATLV